jgi:hypothetical protein
MDKISLLSARIDGYDMNISLSGDKHMLEAAWRVLRKLGFDAPSSRPEANQSSWNGRFHRKADDCTIYLFFTSSVCRRIKTGTKMVEQDIYETVCGETITEETTETDSDSLPF